jgi:AbrB family looped-hinge helix DNA binding protein
MPRWESIGGKAEVGTAVVDEKGRVLIPLEDRTRAGLKPGVELEISQQKQGLLLRPVTPKPIRVRASRSKWGREAFPDAGEATFGG